jgi:hypothetical protein
MTTTTAFVHTPWCNSHVDDPDGRGCCPLVGNVDSGAGVEVAQDSTGALGVLLWQAHRGADVTTAEARQLAAWLVEAAELVERA